MRNMETINVNKMSFSELQQHFIRSNKVSGIPKQLLLNWMLEDVKSDIHKVYGEEG